MPVLTGRGRLRATLPAAPPVRSGDAPAHSGRHDCLTSQVFLPPGAGRACQSRHIRPICRELDLLGSSTQPLRFRTIHSSTNTTPTRTRLHSTASHRSGRRAASARAWRRSTKQLQLTCARVQVPAAAAMSTSPVLPRSTMGAPRRRQRPEWLQDGVFYAALLVLLLQAYSLVTGRGSSGGSSDASSGGGSGGGGGREALADTVAGFKPVRTAQRRARPPACRAICSLHHTAAPSGARVCGQLDIHTAGEPLGAAGHQLDIAGAAGTGAQSWVCVAGRGQCHEAQAQAHRVGGVWPGGGGAMGRGPLAPRCGRLGSRAARVWPRAARTC